MIKEIIEKYPEERFEKPQNKATESPRLKKISELMEKSSVAKTFENWLKARLKIAYSNNDKETEIILREILEKYKDFETIGISKIQGWKGTSGIISLIKKPDRIIVTRMQKPNKDSEPKKVIIEITKEEINAVIIALNELSDNQPIKTKDIAMIFSRELNLKHSDWGRFFADRHYHNLLTNCLDVMDSEQLIKYSGGLTTILKDKLEIQNIL